MSERAHIVQEFQDTVDDIIGDQVRRIRQSHIIPFSRLSYRKVANSGALTFASLDRKDRRPIGIGLSDEHIWAVLSGKMYLSSLGRMASMAVISIANQPDSLTRYLTIDSVMNMINVPTQVTLDTDEQLDDALLWVKTPHIPSKVSDRLSLLHPDEIAALVPKLTEIDAREKWLDDDPRSLIEMCRRSHQDANDSILG